MNKLRWGKFYWSDWAGDAALNRCSMPARGLWMALLCLAAQGKPYGHVTDSEGNAPGRLTLLALTCPRETEPRQFDRWLSELERKGVARRTEDGTLYSVRMVRDAARAEHAAKAGKAKRKLHDGCTEVTPILHDGCTTDARKSAQTRRKGQPIVAGDDGIQITEADASSLLKREEEASAPDAHGDGVVRFNGARRHHALPEPEPRGSDDYLRNLLRSYQAS